MAWCREGNVFEMCSRTGGDKEKTAVIKRCCEFGRFQLWWSSGIYRTSSQKGEALCVSEKLKEKESIQKIGNSSWKKQLKKKMQSD